MASSHARQIFFASMMLFTSLSLSAHLVHSNIKVVHHVFDEIDPTGFLIGNETKDWLAQYLVFRVNGTEIRRGQEIFIDVHDEEIIISLSLKAEIFNSKGLNDGEKKIQLAGNLKNMIALGKFVKGMFESTGIVSSSEQKGIGLFMRVKVKPTHGPISLGAIVVQKIKLWMEKPPRMIISIEEGIELIDC